MCVCYACCFLMVPSSIFYVAACMVHFERLELPRVVINVQTKVSASCPVWSASTSIYTLLQDPFPPSLFFVCHAWCCETSLKCHVCLYILLLILYLVWPVCGAGLRHLLNGKEPDILMCSGHCCEAQTTIRHYKRKNWAHCSRHYALWHRCWQCSYKLKFGDQLVLQRIFFFFFFTA